MNKTKKNSSHTKLILIALMSVTVVFTASACNNANNVDGNANGNVIIEDDNNASGNTTEPEATDEVSTP
ncbi:hypothetical protein [Paenibacillus sp. LHD-38]|uniref:hypothetical protein n=1 Tax=Paenibacillus sp. LHD-38 TaxID=3072143 RepID=UPI00280DC6AE|nr:hypothetical protein [Paenibacillus sp. LHD-38]MDQ8737292.1 hypothetical protein [Paenibacillus sp. LHD-38]